MVSSLNQETGAKGRTTKRFEGVGEKATAWDVGEAKSNKYHQRTSYSVVEQKLLLKMKFRFLMKVQAEKIFAGPNHEMNFLLSKNHFSSSILIMFF